MKGCKRFVGSDEIGRTQRCGQVLGLLKLYGAKQALLVVKSLADDVRHSLFVKINN